MLKQFKYAFRSKMHLRLISLIFLVLVNIIMAISSTLSDGGKYRLGVNIVTVVFSGIALSVWLIICIIADYDAIRGLFSSPKGYHVFLTPVSSKKILGGRLMAIVIPDVIGSFIGILAVVYNAIHLANAELSILDWEWTISDALLTAILSFILYTQFLLFIFLIVVIAKSIFFSRKGGTLLGIIIACGIAYIFSFVDLILMPFASTNIYGPLININVNIGWNVGMMVYLLISIIKAGILFAAVSHLMERRLNI